MAERRRWEGGWGGIWGRERREAGSSRAELGESLIVVNSITNQFEWTTSVSRRGLLGRLVLGASHDLMVL